MSVLWLLLSVLVKSSMGDLPSRQVGDFEESSNWINSLIEHIGTLNARQVTLIVNSESNTLVVSNPVIDELFTKVVEKFPTLRMNFASFNKSTNSFFRYGTEDESFSDSSSTFFIFIHHSPKAVLTLPSQKTIDTMLEISTTKLGSQFLLILVSQKLSGSLKDFLTHVWTKHLLDFTILEFVDTRDTKMSIDSDYAAGIPTIHHLNPFKNEYVKTKWSPNVEWFPDKVRNMWGHRLKVSVIDRPPFSITKFNKYLEPVLVEGANIKVLKIIANELNFTMKYSSDLKRVEAINRGYNASAIFDLMESGKIDILAYLSPHYSEFPRKNSLRTTNVRLDVLCPLVPVLPKVAAPLSFGFFQAYIVYFFIIVAYWIASYILKFRSHTWDPLNIARTVLDIPSSWLPKRVPERILYTSLLLISSICASNIFLSITNMSLQSNVEVVYKSFSDLDNSGLTPMINSYLYGKTFDNNDVSLKNLKRKTLKMRGSPLPDCADKAAKYKNITCLVLQDEGKTAVQYSARRGRAKVKISEPCLWSDSTAFLLGKASPYRSHIDYIIEILANTGILEKWYRETILSVWNDPNDSDGETSVEARYNMKHLRRQLQATSALGFGISTLVFIGEIALGRIIILEKMLRQWRLKRLRLRR